MTTTIYGIKNCDTMRKAMKWLDEQGVEFVFHDYRKDGLDPDLVDRWLDSEGVERLINTRGTTWRKLPEPVRKSLNRASAKSLMLENPSLIKRPVLESGKTRLIGFDADAWHNLFS